MSNSEMYIDFLEGNLDYETEKNFADKFAFDDEFRSGFKGFLSITSSINKNMKAFGPSPIETNAIYSKLGYTIPTGFLPKENLSDAPASFFKSNIFRSAVTGLSSAFLAVVITLLFIKPDNSGISGNNIVKPITTEQIPVAKTINDNQTKTQVKPVIKYIYIDKNQEVKSTGNEIVKNESDHKVLEYSQPVIAAQQNEQNRNPISLNLNYNTPVYVFHPGIETSTAKEKSNWGFTSGIKSSANWNLPRENIYPSEYSKLNNMSFSLYYSLFPHFRLGLDIRQETFFVRYRGVADYQQNFEYYQQPNLTSFGLSAVFDYFGNETYKPLMAFQAGGNQFGFVFRAGPGIEYYIEPDISLLAQLEYSSLVFKHQSQWFSSRKLGINYGINFKF
jgi:hypothetical protein